MQLARFADMRYFGQAWEVRVDVPSGELDREAANQAVARFHAAHARTYGYSYADQPGQRVAWVNLRVTGIGPLRQPSIQRRERAHEGTVDRALTATRHLV